ncbi:MAG: energy transducer TonB [Candidatus Krumholzibacteria bacterium]|nr:energy transducer TonB [Candidatus Krumholzibacteria bacterium]
MTPDTTQVQLQGKAAHSRGRRRSRSRREWLLIIAAVLGAHLVFFLFFRTEYLEIFRTGIKGDEGGSDFILMDRPFSLVPYLDQADPAPVAEPVVSDNGELVERSILDDIGEPAGYIEPIRRAGGGGSDGRPGPRRSVVEPKPLFIPWPAYPDGAPDDIRGTVELMLYVDVNGIVKEIRVSRGLPHETLNRTAVEAARRIRFIPGEEKGAPSAMWVRLSIGFQPR